MAKTVLLDIDGTLIDSNLLHAESWSAALKHFGYDVPAAQILRQIGKGGDEMLPVFIPSDEERSRLQDDLKSYRTTLLWRDYVPEFKPFPKVRELIEKFRATGWKTVMASSANADELQEYKRIANIADLIEEDASSSDARHAKPHPDIFEAAMQRAGAQPDECITLGDTPYDIEASRKAGVRTVCVTTGGWTTVELLAAGAVEVYRDAAELLEKFDSSVFAKAQ